MAKEFFAEEELRSYLRPDKIKGKQFRHKDGEMIALLPYNTKLSGKNAPINLKEDFRSFDGFIGHALRKVINKDLPKSLQEKNAKGNFKKKLKDIILTKATELVIYEGTGKEKLEAIIDSVFFMENNLLKYGSKAQLYMSWNSDFTGLEKVGDFIYNIFFDKGTEEMLKQVKDSKKHVLQTLIDKALPDLEDTIEKSGKMVDDAYYILDHAVIDCFKEDLAFLLRDNKSFLSESDQLFRFYYFFYISRSILKLSDFFNTKEYQLYFTLENESVSESRRTNETGWKTLESKAYKLFSHTVALDLINHIPMVKEKGKMDYAELGEFYQSLSVSDQQELINNVRDIRELYFTYAPDDFDRTGFITYFEQKRATIKLENEFEVQVFDLFHRIDFQFEKGGRKSKRNNYSMWYIVFCKENILKNRGRSGYSLSLSNETLLFLTKLCVKDQQRMRLKDLWTAFKKRGIYFDDLTQQAIVEIYDKINLIEKKSDSGDAQYIRPIL